MTQYVYWCIWTNVLEHLAVPLFRVVLHVIVLWNTAPRGLVLMYQRSEELTALIFRAAKVIFNCYINGGRKLLLNLVTYVPILTASYPRRLTFLSTLPWKLRISLPFSQYIFQHMHTIRCEYNNNNNNKCGCLHTCCGVFRQSSGRNWTQKNTSKASYFVDVEY